jgi:hypothetical protein
MSWQFTVGLRVKKNADRIVVDAEDALIAALKVKAERPEATIIREMSAVGTEQTYDRGRTWSAPQRMADVRSSNVCFCVESGRAGRF